MKKYDDYKKDKSEKHLTTEEIGNIEFTKYVIIVPTLEDKKELEMAFRHIHDSNVDTEYVTVNQLAHEYLNDDIAEGTYNNIIVSEMLYDAITTKIKRTKNSK